MHARLDYFDEAYVKEDADGEYAGFTISGHVTAATFEPTQPALCQLEPLLAVAM